MSLPPAPEGYPYGTVWKANVDRHGPEWRAYCDEVAGRPGGAARAERLKRDVRLIGKHEGRDIRALVLSDPARRLDAVAA